MDVVCQVTNKKDLATLTAAWKKHSKNIKKCAGDWVSHTRWSAAVVDLIPPGRFEPTHEYKVGSANGAVFIVDAGVAQLFVGMD